MTGFIARSIGLMFLLIVPTTWACTTRSGGGGYASNLTVRAFYAAAPLGTLITPWHSMFGGADGHTYYFGGCSSTDRIAITARGSSSLRYVAMVTVGGNQYAAYEVTPTSPLFIFDHVTEIGSLHNAGKVTTPVTDISNIRSQGATPAPGGAGGRDKERTSYFQYALVGRGHLMTGLPSTLVVNFTSYPDAYPSLNINTSLTASIDVEMPTCAPADTTVTLDDVSLGELNAVGKTSGAKDFSVRMYCSGVGRNMTISLIDANNKSNIGTELTPSAGSDAQGVRLQILRSGAPVRMGSSWNGGGTSAAYQNVDLTARYYRAAVGARPGLLGAKVTLQVDYN
ncbi:MAG: hypothetical protein GAK28_01529 [Luteibacter sp.]|uniref:fimbrial protein n=1 Tax=Luteibacter sp. TaxID=1886636 RepID=UPI00137E599A|nr:fimbrial protein [Luteibacter sp.]KAF1008052.1 MAG: hypothetical protein GAK28_01529 [Luteibacter sp.]